MQRHTHTHTHTHGGIVGQKMTGAVMRETETLYSAPEMEGRIGDRGSDGERKVLGMTSPFPLTPPHFSPSPSHSLTPSPQPPPPPSNPQRCTLAWNTGAHTLKLVCVFVYVDFSNRAEALNRQTCM